MAKSGACGAICLWFGMLLFGVQSVGIGACQQSNKLASDVSLTAATPTAINDHATELLTKPSDHAPCGGVNDFQIAVPPFEQFDSTSRRLLVLSCLDSLDDSATADVPEPRIELSSSKSSLVQPLSPGPEHKVGGVQWNSLMKASAMYLGVMHGFRIATEKGTREGFHTNALGGYFRALGSMHGWSDGDGYYENYLGHPIEGSVASYIWIHNDPKYRTVEFGKSRDYWMSRLRAYGYAWAFSEQFEIGITSEASIGQIQRYCCAYGFVDHVVTPNFGMIWVIGGDALDRYVVQKAEDRTQNVAIRALLRTTLNAPLTFANIMTLQVPWHRENRDGVRSYSESLIYISQFMLKGVFRPCRTSLSSS